MLLLLLLSRFSRVRLCATRRRKPTRLPRPWDSPGNNTGVGRGEKKKGLTIVVHSLFPSAPYERGKKKSLTLVINFLCLGTPSFLLVALSYTYS